MLWIFEVLIAIMLAKAINVFMIDSEVVSWEKRWKRISFLNMERNWNFKLISG